LPNRDQSIAGRDLATTVHWRAPGPLGKTEDCGLKTGKFRCRADAAANCSRQLSGCSTSSVIPRHFVDGRHDACSFHRPNTTRPRLPPPPTSACRPRIHSHHSCQLAVTIHCHIARSRHHAHKLGNAYEHLRPPRCPEGRKEV
jgi:hypothetical protein